MNKQEKSIAVPIWERATLSREEAAAYTGIGENKLREMTMSAGCDFVLWVGQKRLIKRKKLEDYLDRVFSV